jgi:hypothetical protein
MSVKLVIIYGCFHVNRSCLIGALLSKMWKKTPLKAVFLCFKNFYLKKNTLD